MSIRPAPARPALHAEEALVRAIVRRRFPPGATLPAERELARQLGVTRPTLREVLQRLQRDGWLVIRHGKGTRVNDVWRDGGLSALSALVRHCRPLPGGFIRQLLEVREALAPAYAREAAEHAPEEVGAYLAEHPALDESPQAYAGYDWGLHRRLATSSGNPVHVLILNGFVELYAQMAVRYFRLASNRRASRRFYAGLEKALRRSPSAVERVTRAAMQESLALWGRVEGRKGRS